VHFGHFSRRSDLAGDLAGAPGWRQRGPAARRSRTDAGDVSLVIRLLEME
jgi:hypothetical protein